MRIAVALVLATSTVGCGDDDGGVPDSGPGTDGGRTDSGPPADAGGDGGGVDGGPTTTVASAHDFNGAAFELPEGVVLTGGDALVGIAPTGVVVRVAADGTTTPFGNVTFTVAGSSYLLGLAVDAMGRVYAGVGAVDAGAEPGIYRIPAAGGDGVLFASDAMMQFPNGLDFDAAGNLYVADSTGRIFIVDDAGTASVWSEDAMLAAAATSPCGDRITPFPIGVNGIVVESDRVIVAHTDAASLLSVAIETDGSAGAVTEIVADCTNLLGIDGIGQESAGSWLAVMQGTNGVARVTEDGTVTVLHTGAPLDGPASVDVGMFGATRQAVITSSGFVTLETGGTPMPNLSTLAPVM